VPREQPAQVGDLCCTGSQEQCLAASEDRATCARGLSCCPSGTNEAGLGFGECFDPRHATCEQCPFQAEPTDRRLICPMLGSAPTRCCGAMARFGPNLTAPPVALLPAHPANSSCLAESSSVPWQCCITAGTFGSSFSCPAHYSCCSMAHPIGVSFPSREGEQSCCAPGEECVKAVCTPTGSKLLHGSSSSSFDAAAVATSVVPHELEAPTAAVAPEHGGGCGP